MKIAYKDIVKNIVQNPDIEELSDKLFQLGHEHEINNSIFDMELTPNRGDCLSVLGLLRDLRLFYDINNEIDFYNKDIGLFDFNFINNAKNSCPNISFLKVEIDEIPLSYKGSLNDYFNNLNLKKNNFFTDISNFISYEMGQPTHCYDSFKLGNSLTLDFIKGESSFNTLLDKEIIINDDLVFYNKQNEIVNLAGVVGGKNSACNEQTKSVIVECGYFDPEIIIGKTIKYDIRSEAAHKFERDTDKSSHQNVLRRFIKIIEEHSTITNIELLSESYYNDDQTEINFNVNNFNKILGIKISKEKCTEYLSKLGFTVHEDTIFVPTYRNDITTENDISEELARAIGYDNIEKEEIVISCNNQNHNFHNERSIKSMLSDNGFFEVINNPFVSKSSSNAIKVDNPLDTNRQYIRTDLKQSLIDNLLYNERRQNDSVKLFEISDIYRANTNPIRVIGIIASGRLGKNYKDFNNKITDTFISDIFRINAPDLELNLEHIPRDNLDTKSDNYISYVELDISLLKDVVYEVETQKKLETYFKKYNPISEYPCSIRDLSFSIKNSSQLPLLEELILGEKYPLLKESFVFDYFNNEKKSEIKIGFRFIFQSKISTITDTEVDNIMNDIIKNSLSISSVSIPGLHNK